MSDSYGFTTRKSWAAVASTGGKRGGEKKRAPSSMSMRCSSFSLNKRWRGSAPMVCMVVMVGRVRNPLLCQHRLEAKKKPPRCGTGGAKSRERSGPSRRASNGGDDDNDGHGKEAETCCEGRVWEDHEDSRKKTQSR